MNRTNNTETLLDQTPSTESDSHATARELCTELFSGFSKLTRSQRIDRLMKMGFLSPDQAEHLCSDELLNVELAENCIENALGYFQMPMGVAAHLVIDGKPYAIPMAVEETSIIAAASKTAKWIKEKGEITTTTEGAQSIGQIQIAQVKDLSKLKATLQKEKQNWIEACNTSVAEGLVRRGGGVSDIQLRILDRSEGLDEFFKDTGIDPHAEISTGHMVVFHVLVDTCDAMGANIINQICEFLKPLIQESTGETVTMCILSNLVDTKLAVARVRISNVPMDWGTKIQEASLFAWQDPYRAATHNKGVLNGIDPILIATGNDWRAVDSGVHAYAARTGQYRSVTRWIYNKEDEVLVGEFKAPLVTGTVGGMTRIHPMAQIALSMLGVKSAEELSRVCAAVGLVQNLGALRALVTVGIIEGHMKLHIKNLSINAGAEKAEMHRMQQKLENILRKEKRISLSHARRVLEEIRKKQSINIENYSSTEY